MKNSGSIRRPPANGGSAETYQAYVKNGRPFRQVVLVLERDEAGLEQWIMQPQDEKDATSSYNIGKHGPDLHFTETPLRQTASDLNERKPGHVQEPHPNHPTRRAHVPSAERKGERAAPRRDEASGKEREEFARQQEDEEFTKVFEQLELDAKEAEHRYALATSHLVEVEASYQMGQDRRQELHGEFASLNDRLDGVEDIVREFHDSISLGGAEQAEMALKEELDGQRTLNKELQSNVDRLKVDFKEALEMCQTEYALRAEAEASLKTEVEKVVKLDKASIALKEQLRLAEGKLELEKKWRETENVSFEKEMNEKRLMKEKLCALQGENDRLEERINLLDTAAHATQETLGAMATRLAAKEASYAEERELRTKLEAEVAALKGRICGAEVHFRTARESWEAEKAKENDLVQSELKTIIGDLRRQLNAALQELVDAGARVRDLSALLDSANCTVFDLRMQVKKGEEEATFHMRQASFLYQRNQGLQEEVYCLRREAASLVRKHLDEAQSFVDKERRYPCSEASDTAAEDSEDHKQGLASSVSQATTDSEREVVGSSLATSASV